MLDSARELVLLVNGRSRIGTQRAVEARAALEAEGFLVRDFQVTTRSQEFEHSLMRHIENREPVISIGGGDGTQRLAAERIAGSDSVLAVFPLGTGNAWASDLGIPVGPGPTAKALASAKIESIDLGMANGLGFVNVATIGLTALIVKNMPTESKGRFGRLVYLPAVIRSLRELRPFALTVKTDDENYEGLALQFVAGAGRTHAGPFRVTRISSNNDGRLSLYVLDDTDRRGLARFGLALLMGRHTLLDDVWTCEAEQAQVTTRPGKRLVVDGERAGKSPLVLSIRHRVLRVLIPEDARRAGSS